jgi:hypothetical protein
MKCLTCLANGRASVVGGHLGGQDQRKMTKSYSLFDKRHSLKIDRRRSRSVLRLRLLGAGGDRRLEIDKAGSRGEITCSQQSICVTVAAFYDRAHVKRKFIPGISRFVRREPARSDRRGDVVRLRRSLRFGSVRHGNNAIVGRESLLELSHGMGPCCYIFHRRAVELASCVSAKTQARPADHSLCDRSRAHSYSKAGS